MLLALYLFACQGLPAGEHEPAAAAAPLGRTSAAGPAAPPDEDADPVVLINEVAPENDSLVMDEAGELEGWVELWSPEGAQALRGWTLELDGEAWPLPDSLRTDDQGRLLLWLDGDLDQGEAHAPLHLEGAGELRLEGPSGALADRWTWTDAEADLVLARFPDGGALKAETTLATPGAPNPAEPGASLDPSDTLFPQDRVLRFDLDLPADSLEVLRVDPYAPVVASLAFEGVYFPRVSVHLKGQWGSLRSVDAKAAFRVSLDTYGDHRLRGMEHVTLNNMVQDASFVHEREAWRLFRAAGLPGARTAHAAVYVNGEYRGLYLHLETIDDQFLSRYFADGDGNLYEGEYGQDITPSGYEELEWDEEGSDDVSDRSDLLGLATLLALEPSEALVPELEARVDVETTLRVLAAEVLLGHWDGYFYYPNNYRFYHDPSTGQFTLIPWGLDQTFGWTGSLTSPSGRLARWMLAVPSLERRWQLALWELSDTLLDLDVRADVLYTQALIRPYVEADPYREGSLEDMEAGGPATADFVDVWPVAVLDSLFPAGAPDWE